jgi:hypothetical protein
MATTVLSDKGHFAGLHDYDDPTYKLEVDCPIIVHTLVSAGVHINRYAIRDFLNTPLPHSDLKLRWLHVPVNNMDWVDVSVCTFILPTRSKLTARNNHRRVFANGIPAPPDWTINPGC